MAARATNGSGALSASPLEGAARDLLPRTPSSTFQHPYTPYPIQIQLMSRLYTALRRKQVGVFESPTGTGKTLSVICSSLQWLREYQEYGSDEESVQTWGTSAPSAAAVAVDDEPDWCKTYDREKEEREKRLSLAKAKERREALEGRLAKLRAAERAAAAAAAGGSGSSSSSSASGAGIGLGITREQRKARAKQLAQRKRKRAAAVAAAAAAAAAGGSGEGGDDELLVPEYHSGSDTDASGADEDRTGTTTGSSSRGKGVKGKGKGKGKGSSSSSSSNAAATAADDGGGVSEAAVRTISLADKIRAEIAAGNGAGGTSAKSGSGKAAGGPGPAAAAGAGGGGGRAFLDPADAEEEEADAAAFRPKIFFVSRTHSQITQFVREIGRTVFGRDARVVVLGSRKNLCVNPDVLSLPSDARINERCLELQDEGKRSNSSNKTPQQDHSSSSAARDALEGIDADLRHTSKAASMGFGGLRVATATNDGRDAAAESGSSSRPHAGCPFLDSTAQEAFSDRLLASLRDVEDAADLGWEAGTCAYYGSRKAVRHAEIVALPYSMLLHEGTRESAGIVLDGSAVIIDEAHNIIDAIIGAHSAVVSLSQLTTAAASIRAYLEKYASRMKGSNVAYCTQLVETVEGFAAFLRSGVAPRTGAGPKAATAAAAVAATTPSTGGGKTIPPGASPAGAPVGSGLQGDHHLAGPFAPFPHSLPPSRGNSPTRIPGAAAVAAAAGAATAAPKRSVSPINFWGKPKPAVEAASAAGGGGGREAGGSSGGTGGSGSRSTLNPAAAAAAPTMPKPPQNEIHSVSDFFISAGLASINLFKLCRYVDAVQLLRKLRGFAEAGAAAAAAAAAETGDVLIHSRSGKVQSSSASAAGSSSASAGPAPPSYMASVASIQATFSFLGCLMSADGDGRVIATRIVPAAGAGVGGGNAPSSSPSASSSAPTEPFYKFVLLNPAVPFEKVVSKARSVVLVGGTMQPMSDIVSQLFGHLPKPKVMTFSCGHIIPRDNLACFAVAKGPAGVAFDFRHATRSSPPMMDELGRALVNLATLVPAGLVVFLPSYDYLRTVLAHWGRPAVGGGGGGSSTASSEGSSAAASSALLLPGELGPGALGSILAQLAKRKRIFSEPRSSADVDAVLRAYSAAATSSTLLLTGGIVPGGKARGRDRRSGYGSETDGDGEGLVGTDLETDDDGTDAYGYSTDDSTFSSSTRGGGRGKGVERSSSSSSSSAPLVAPSPRSAGAGRPPSASPDSSHQHLSLAAAGPLKAPAGTVVAGAGAGGGGAILFSVVGGKMSEGINFSDDLARCVAVVGLPFPNPSDPELLERMGYLDRRIATAAGGAAGAAGGASSAAAAAMAGAGGKEYYENVTMRAVNQAIGRSIRHAGDHACIVLLDGRYVQAKVRGKLPGWIGDSVVEAQAWGTVAGGVATFFRKKREAAGGGGGAGGTAAASGAAAGGSGASSAAAAAAGGGGGAGGGGRQSHHLLPQQQLGTQ